MSTTQLPTAPGLTADTAAKIDLAKRSDDADALYFAARRAWYRHADAASIDGGDVDPAAQSAWAEVIDAYGEHLHRTQSPSKPPDRPRCPRQRWRGHRRVWTPHYGDRGTPATTEDTMPAPKTFATATAADVKPPVAFSIGYVDRGAPNADPPVEPKPGTLTLHALTDRGLATIEALTEGIMRDEGSGRPVYNPAALIRFFCAVLVPEDVDSFLRLNDDKQRVVKIDDLGEAMAWLCEEITGRPLAKVGGSSGGSSRTGTGASGGGQPLA